MASGRARRLANGDIVFSKKDTPPEAIEGYTQDPVDPYHFRMNLVPCSHRCYKEELCCEGRAKRKQMYCNLLDEATTTLKCKECELND